MQRDTSQGTTGLNKDRNICVIVSIFKSDCTSKCYSCKFQVVVMVSQNTKECLTEKKIFNKLTLVVKTVVARVIFTSNFLIDGRKLVICQKNQTALLQCSPVTMNDA